MKGHPFTPKVECDHSCQVRRRYKTKNHAKAASTSVFARTGKLRHVEACRHCNGWHLGFTK